MNSITVCFTGAARLVSVAFLPQLCNQEVTVQVALPALVFPATGQTPQGKLMQSTTVDLFTLFFLLQREQVDGVKRFLFILVCYKYLPPKCSRVEVKQRNVEIKRRGP